ncbi:MAG: hypothetical protein PHC31_00975 [Clostridia bacterium]|nr:hypothetical protein [Clostridia bacterium]
MARKEKRNKFRDKVVQDTTRQKNATNNYGYLKLPKDVRVFQPEAGRIQLDILPYIVTDEKHPDRNVEMEIAIPGELWYKRPFKVHRNIGAENDTVVCLTSFSQRCPICEYLAKRRKEGADLEEIKTLRPSQRNLYCVIPIGVKGADEKPHVWDVSQYLFQNLLNEELEEDSDNAVFPDLEEGLTLRIRFEEQQLGKNKFNEAKRIDFEKRDEIYDDSILEDIPNLDEMLTRLTYEELDAKFLEMEGVAEVEETSAVENTEVRKRKKIEPDIPAEAPVIRRRKAKPEPEPEPEPEDEDETDVIGKGETPPPVRRRKAKPEPEPEPEDDDDDEIYEDEPEPELPVKPIKRDNLSKPASKGKPADGDRCPHGHRFGVDCEKFDDCDVCEIWDECIDEQEKR